MLQLIALPLLLTFAGDAFADDALRCELARGAASQAFSAPLAEGSGETQASAFGLALDSSLGGSSYLVALGDSVRPRRAAFTGAAGSISVDGSRLTMGDASTHCALAADTPPSLEPPAAPAPAPYFVCMLDEASFVGGTPVDSKRRLFRALTPLSPHLPVAADAEDDATAFHVSFVSFDPFHGLRATISDKATGETASYDGPARSMGTSFLLGLTLGDRSTAARFLRLGCVWTSDPNSFK